MILINMNITEGVNEFTGLETAYLSDHMGEDGVRRDIKGDSEEYIGATLIKLATELIVLVNIELEEGMAGGEGHEVDFTGVPGDDHMAARMGVAFNVVNQRLNLVNEGSIGTLPLTPLCTVDTA